MNALKRTAWAAAAVLTVACCGSLPLPCSACAARPVAPPDTIILDEIGEMLAVTHHASMRHCPAAGVPRYD